MAIGLSACSNTNLTFIYYAILKLSSNLSTHIYILFREVVFYLNKAFESVISKIDLVDKEDLDLINHLSGKTQKYLKLSFKNI